MATAYLVMYRRVTGDEEKVEIKDEEIPKYIINAIEKEETEAQ